VGLHLAPALGAVATAVGEAQALEVAAGGGEHGQVLGVDGGAAERRADRGRAQRGHAAAQVAGQDLLELDQRAHGGLLDPSHRRARGGAQADGDRDGLLVVDQQRRDCGAGPQPVAAGGAAEGVHRVAELAQPVDVAADGPPGDAEPLGQLGAGPVAPRLEQREELQEAPGGRRHAKSHGRGY
jgi:hypothetical protein